MTRYEAAFDEVALLTLRHWHRRGSPEIEATQFCFYRCFSPNIEIPVVETKIEIPSYNLKYCSGLLGIDTKLGTICKEFRSSHTGFDRTSVYFTVVDAAIPPRPIFLWVGDAATSVASNELDAENGVIAFDGGNVRNVPAEMAKVSQATRYCGKSPWQTRSLRIVPPCPRYGRKTERLLTFLWITSYCRCTLSFSSTSFCMGLLSSSLLMSISLFSKF